MKRILLTCTDLMAIQFFINHITFWHNNGYCVDVVCSSVGDRVEELIQKLDGLKNVEVNTVDLSRSPFKISNLKGYRQMKKAVNKYDYDCIVTNEPVMGLITRLAARNKKCKVVYIAHGFHFYKGNSAIKNFIYRNIEKITAKYTNVLVTINREDFESSKKLKLKKAGEYKYIPGIGVDFKKFAPVDNGKRNELRKDLGIKSDDIAMVAVAELNRNKNQRILIEGIAKLDNPNLKLFLIGKGDQYTALKEFAETLGISNQIIFMGYRRDVPQLLPAFDIGVSASIREGLGLNLIEEMACGLPIVASINRGHLDIVEEGCGYLFNNNVGDFVKHSKLLIDSQTERIRIGQFNIESCRRFEMKKVQKLLFEIINN